MRREIVEREKKSGHKVSASFKVGAIALAFLVIGYQVALFVHSAAVTRLASHRDAPDTVFVIDEGTARRVLDEDGGSISPAGYASGGLSPSRNRATPGTVRGRGPSSDGRGRAERDVSEGDNPPETHDGTIIIRKEAERDRQTEAVREKVMPRVVESFPFDPNTVSLRDLQRLGFSEKQAISIDNYRQKGGRFRRASDFARSYVVADSVFKRLEPYIRIPKVDINAADSAAFDSLPGIGPYFARKMISYRDELHGYSFPEQLMDIYNFDREKFDGLKDLITVGPHEPYPLWTLPEEELKKHPYIGTYGAHGVIVFRNNNPDSLRTVEGLIKAGVLKPELGQKLAMCEVE